MNRVNWGVLDRTNNTLVEVNVSSRNAAREMARQRNRRNQTSRRYSAMRLEMRRA